MKTKSINLNGQWTACWHDGVRGFADTAIVSEIDSRFTLPVRVPGEIHDDLIRAGRIPDPYKGANILACRWVEECLWSYRRTFQSPPLKRRTQSWLLFEGLDYAARIFLNGVEIGTHSNYFRPCRINITNHLRKGRNILAVQLDSGLFHVSEKPSEGWMCQGNDQRLHKRHWLRKPQFQAGWDWSGRLINLGIHGNVRIETTTAPLRLDAFSPVTTLDDSLEKGTVRGRFVIEGLQTKAFSATVRVTCGGITASSNVKIEPGIKTYDVSLSLSRPRLWWPVHHGPQNLYKVVGTVLIENNTIHTIQKTVGFRKIIIREDPSPLPRDNKGLQGMDTVRVDRNYQPEKGRTFIVEVNHRPIFCKGANFVPSDMILTRINRQRYETLIDRTLESGFNLLRVWGGGLYESDDFYNLCNRHGIMVWQDFTFACGKYPSQNPAFLENVTAEATYQVRRLAPNPSLIIWCGNNEMEWIYQWCESPTSAEKHIDYGLFHFVLPQIVRTEDASRPYRPSSPWSPEGLYPNADEAGDQHPWCVGFNNQNFYDYRRLECRFANEGGFLGPNSLPAVKLALDGEKGIGGPVWQVRDNSVSHWCHPSNNDKATQQWLGHAMQKYSLEEYVYWTGLLQGEALSEYIHNFRWRMFTSAAAVFWMFNDCWPTPRSWTTVDYLLNRTPAFHPVRRAFAPVHVIVTRTDSEVRIFGINETQNIMEAHLNYGLFRMDGGYPLNESISVKLQPNCSTLLARFPARLWKSPAKSVAFAQLKQNSSLLSRHRLILLPFKDMAWEKPAISIVSRKGEVEFKSPHFVWGVCLDLVGRDSLADNFFDLYPNIPYRIPWARKSRPRILHTGNLV